MKTWRDSSAVEGFHAHVYFSRETRASAAALHERMLRYGAGVQVHNMAEGPRGPHVQTMFGMDIPKAAFADVFSLLIVNHGPHSVLIHPVTGHELLDHTHHAVWLGQPQPLDLSVLV